MRRVLYLGVIAALLTALAGCDTVIEMVVSNLPQMHTERATLVVSLRVQEVVGFATVSRAEEAERRKPGEWRGYLRQRGRAARFTPTTPDSRVLSS